MFLTVWSFLKASAEFLTLQGPPASSFIGVLDIFGFEHFKVAGEVDAKCIQVPHGSGRYTWRLSFTGIFSLKTNGFDSFFSICGRGFFFKGGKKNTLR